MNLSKRIKQVTPSATLDITAKAKQLKQEGVDVISLSAGEPDFDTPQAVKSAAIQALNEGFTKYTPVSGIPELKKALSRELARANHLSYEPDQIVVTCGAKHAVYNALQVLVDEGDEVIIPSPYWLSYPEMVILAGGKPVILRTGSKDGYTFTAKQLEKLITKRTKGIIINSPSNPTGAVFSKTLLEEIGRIVKDRSLFVISDEIYGELVYDGVKHYSIGALDPDVLARTVTVGGASKSYAMTGWRLGFLAAPKSVASASTALQSHSTSNPTSFAQRGYLEALRSGAADVEKMRKRFEERRNLIYRIVNEIPKLTPFKPSGAFYLFVDISKTKLKSIDFANRLLDQAKVAVVPGAAFGDDNAVRLSFAASEQDIESGIDRIREWLHKI